MGRAAREAVLRQVPLWRKQWALDFVIVNGENAAGGFGITPAIAEAFFEAGVDVISTGNHVWDQQEIQGYIDTENRLLRPVNFPIRHAGHRGQSLSGGRAARDGGQCHGAVVHGNAGRPVCRH